jgi:hypothetical protein
MLFINEWDANADVLIVKNLLNIQVVLESSWTISVVTAWVKDERGGQGHTSASLLHQSAM